MEAQSLSDFLKALVHPGHTAMQEYAASAKDEVLLYDNIDIIPKGTPVISMMQLPDATLCGNDLSRCAGADFNEAMWYVDNKGYSQQIPRKLAVAAELKRIARNMEKLAMAVTSFHVSYDKQHTLTITDNKGIKFVFDDFDAAYARPLKDWLIKEVKDKEHLGNSAIEDIVMEIFSELKTGATDFQVKFFNF